MTHVLCQGGGSGTEHIATVAALAYTTGHAVLAPTPAPAQNTGHADVMQSTGYAVLAPAPAPALGVQ